MSPKVAAFADEIRSWCGGAWEAGFLVDIALDAAVRLEQAEALVRDTRDDVSALLAGEALDLALLSRRLAELIRYNRYDCRLRGRRDRAIRKLIALRAGEPA